MKTFRFFDFPVYHQAKRIYKEILEATEDVNDFALKNQIRRAALSIVLNIAEGSAKKSDKEFARFLETSIASANEVVACLDIMIDINLINKEKYQNLFLEMESVVKQLGGFIRKLNSQ